MSCTGWKKGEQILHMAHRTTNSHAAWVNDILSFWTRLLGTDFYSFFFGKFDIIKTETYESKK